MSAPGARAGRLAGAVLRCYPASWRRRHGDEAAELAALLIADGTPAASIAWSYLLGAAREWLAPRPGRVVSTVAAALLAAACLLGFSAALVAESAPARAAGTSRAPSGAVPPTITPASPGAARRVLRPGRQPRRLLRQPLLGAHRGLQHHRQGDPGDLARQPSRPPRPLTSRAR